MERPKVRWEFPLWVFFAQVLPSLVISYLRLEGIIKSTLPVIFCGIVGIYGLIIAIIMQNNCMLGFCRQVTLSSRPWNPLQSSKEFR